MIIDNVSQHAEGIYETAKVEFRIELNQFKCANSKLSFSQTLYGNTEEMNAKFPLSNCAFHFLATCHKELFLTVL